MAQDAPQIPTPVCLDEPDIIPAHLVPPVRKTKKQRTRKGPWRPRRVPRPPGSPPIPAPEPLDEATKGQIHREGALRSNRKVLTAVRDIAPLDVEINWERRLACEKDFGRFCKTYLPNTFRLSWSKSHLACIEKIETVYMDTGKFALAMPRGHGKTALCRASLIWGTAYAHRLFPFLIGSAQPKAQASLAYVKTAWYGSPELRQDFPEIGHAVHKLENRWHLARGQIYNGFSTYIDWGTDDIRYPILLLPPEIASVYLEHCPGFLIHLPEQNDRPECWITRSAGITINTAGIDGSIRGEAGVHPILLTQPRPDVVLIDDIQKDNKVDSTLSCDKLKLLIDGAISLLSGPDQSISALMPCTVMREGDVADTYVDIEKRPEWRGERHARVLTWPEGIDDEKVTMDSLAGMKWTEYDKLRRASFQQFKDMRLATEFYANPENRKVMDEGFTVSWDENYDKKLYLSAQQAAMNDRFELGSSVFMAECQNKGRRPLGEGIISVKAEQLREKITTLPQRKCPIDTRSLVIHIDVQNEIFYWTAFASAPDFTGVFCDYGTWPPVNMPYFRKAQTEEWSLLSKIFFEAYPEQRGKATQSAHGWRAPLEAKIYHGLGLMVRYLLQLNFVRDDPFCSPVHVQRIGIDTRWGQVTDTIKRFIRDWSKKGAGESPITQNQSGYVTRDILIPYFGQGITPLQRQMEEMTRTRGWLFEDQINPRAREVRWIWKPDEMGTYALHVDVNRMKTFLFQRLASPPGVPGSVTLYDGPPEVHALFADHLCKSEFPYDAQINTLTQSLRKQMWKAREGVAFDNDYLDTATGCMALASFNGSFLQHDDDDRITRSQKKRMSDRWNDKKANRQLTH